MKKLLITLGCSYTEGMGCYDYSKFPKGKHIYSDGVSESQIKEQIDRFHEMGYPNRLGKKLKYDKVINLGVSGGSTSGQIKKFTEKYWNNSFSEFDEVLIFFWLPHSHRFSFYTNGRIVDIIPTAEDINHPQEILGKSYINFIKDYPSDYIKEQVFYLKMISSYCKLMGFNFLWFLDDTFFGESVIDEFPLDNWIGIRGKEISDEIYSNSQLINESCFHPNENGYELYSQKFYDKINKDFNFLIGSNHGIINWEYI